MKSCCLFLIILGCLFESLYCQDGSAPSEDTKKTSNEKKEENKSKKPDDVIELPKSVVKGGKVDEINTYNLKVENSLTRSDIPLSKTPRSIQIISKEMIESTNTKDLRELYRYMVGVTPEAFMGQFFARGFRSDHTIFIDGMQNGRTMEHYNPKLNNVERVENHRGPSGIVYGPQESPGGIINIVTKRPQAEFDAGVKMEVAQYDTFNTSVDVTGAIDDKKRFLYRLDADYGQTHTFRDRKDLSGVTVVPSFAYVLSDTTRFDLQYTFIDDSKKGYRDRGIPFIDGHIDGKVVVPRDSTTQESDDFIDSLSNAVLGIATHEFLDESKLNVKFRYVTDKQDIRYHEPNKILADGTTMQRIYRRFDKTNEAFSFKANWSKSLETENFVHNISAGIDYSDSKNSERFRVADSVENGGQVPSIDIFNPIFGQGDPSTYLYTNRDTDAETSRQLTGVFAQYQATVYENIHFMGSVRFEHYEDEVDSKDNLKNTNSHDNYDDDAIGFRGGIMYQLLDPIAIFVSYDQAYEPQSPGSQDKTKGGPFDPQESFQWEAGLKTTWFDDKWTVNLTYYHIIKQHVLQTNLIDDTKLDELGEVQSKGVELEVIGRLNEYWWVTGNFATNHAEITEDRDPAKIGLRPTPPPPDQSGSFWINYNKPLSWNFGIGMNYVDKRIVNINNNETLPSYTRWDANIGYTFKHAKVKAYVENIDDKVYYSGGYGGTRGGLPGAPRTFGIIGEWRF